MGEVALFRAFAAFCNVRLSKRWWIITSALKSVCWCMMHPGLWEIGDSESEREMETLSGKQFWPCRPPGRVEPCTLRTADLRYSFFQMNSVGELYYHNHRYREISNYVTDFKNILHPK